MPDRAFLLAGAGAMLALAALAWYGQRRIAAAIPEGAFNPTSPDNLAYSGVNALGASLSGDQNFTLGGAIYEQGIFQAPNVFAFVGDAIVAPVNALRKSVMGERAPLAPVSVAPDDGFDFWALSP